MHISTIFKFALFACAALPTVLCAPIIHREHALSPEHRPNDNLDTYDHDGHLVAHAAHMPPESLATRAFVQFYPRNPVDKANIHLGPAAKQGLHDGVDPTHHAAIEDYHKDIVKQHMETIPGAHSAQITHLEHYGGSNYHEPLHITANYFDEHGKQIKSPYSIQKEQATGTKTEGSFHVYNNQQQHPVAPPKAWEDKLTTAKAEHDAKLPARLAAEAHDADKSKAAANRIAQVKQSNADRVQKQKNDAIAAKAQRQAEKKAIQDAAEI